MNKQQVIIFGGSFDPIHNGHLSLAREALRCGLAGEVWFMVSPQNPHKQQCALTDETQRLEMVKLAVEGEEGLVACDFEFSLPRPSYTFNTLQALEETFPHCEFSLLIGADNWEKFDRWYNASGILSRYRVIVYPRDNDVVPVLPAGVVWLPAQLCDVSSTMVREAVATGSPVSGLVPPVVEEYVKKNGLYKNR